MAAQQSTSATASTTTDFGYEVIPEPPKKTGGPKDPLSEAEATAIMSALESGWVQAPQRFKSEKEAANQSWRLRKRLVAAGKISAVSDLERRIVPVEDGQFAFALGKKQAKKAKAKK